MDIQVASNFERYLFYLVDEDPRVVRALMQQLADTGGFSVSEEQRRRVAALFVAEAVSEADTLAQVRETYEACGYILDPHTAVGVRAARDWPEAICLATAHPAKFGDTVRRAIGVEAAPPASLQGLMDRGRRCVELDATGEAVRAFIDSTLAATD
jgi:threonine synthase